MRRGLCAPERPAPRITVSRWEARCIRSQDPKASSGGSDNPRGYLQMLARIGGVPPVTVDFAWNSRE